jgi:hypothetical protein
VNTSTTTSAIPPGWTLRISLGLLALVAVVQVVAVIWKVLPAAIVKASGYGEEEELVVSQPFRPEIQDSGSSDSEFPEVSPAEMQAALAYANQAESAQRVGDWETAMEALSQTIAILGETPELRFRRAFYLERLGREQESLAELDALRASPSVPEPIRGQAGELASRIRQILANVKALGLEEPHTSPGTTMFIEENVESPPPIREEFGLQPGAMLGIVDVREIDRGPENKVLRIAIKSRPNSEVDAGDVKIHVQFFEKTPSGELTLTTSMVRSEWISPPVDWADNEPEILDVVYFLPGTSGREEDDPDSANEYHGYIVGVYHNDELQDTRSVPGVLERQFPLQLFLDPTES